MTQYQATIKVSPTFEDAKTSDVIVGVFEGLESSSPFWNDDFRSKIFDFKGAEKEVCVIYNTQG